MLDKFVNDRCLLTSTRHHHLHEELASLGREMHSSVKSVQALAGFNWRTQYGRVSLQNESGQDFKGILETHSVDALK